MLFRSHLIACGFISLAKYCITSYPALSNAICPHDKPSKSDKTEEKRGITPCIKHGVFVPFSKSISRSIIIVNLKVNHS